MREPGNVEISFKLFSEILALLDYIYFSNTRIPSVFHLDSMRSELHLKRKKINLRSAYSRILRSKDDEQRAVERKAYLKLKSELSDYILRYPP
jgi:hypothetical protein